MIKKQPVKSPKVIETKENEFRDTSSIEDYSCIYDILEDIGLDLDDILDYLKGYEDEESAYLLDKLAKVRKYMAGIAFTPGCYDSQTGYGSDSSRAEFLGAADGFGYAEVPNEGGYPGECVATSE